MTEHRWLMGWALGSVPVGAASLLVPLYIVELGGTSVDLGILGAMVALIGAPGALVFGRLADRTTNPRQIVIGSLGGVGVLLGLIPLVSSIPIVILLNALLWLVFSAAGPVLTLLVVANVAEDEWSTEIALLNKYQGYGWAGGLLFGIAWSGTVGRVLSPADAQQYLLVACACTALVAATLLARQMPAPTERKLKRVDPEQIAKLVNVGRRGVRGATFLFTPNRLYWSTRVIHPRQIVDRFTPTLATYYLSVVLFFTGFSAFFAPLPLYLTEVGFSSDVVFAMYLVTSLGSAAFYTGAGALSSRYDLRMLQTSALGVRAIAMPLVAVVGTTLAASLTGIVTTGVLFVVIGLTWAVITVTGGTIVARLAPEGLRGEALGVYAALATLAGGIGSIAGGALAESAGFFTAVVVAGLSIFTGAGLVAALSAISTRTGPRTHQPIDE